MSKNAATNHPIHNTLAVRWSPYAFSDRPVRPADVASLFEAARWAPSSYNEQPWRYILGIKGDGETHERILACLIEKNRAWVQNAPVLAIGVVVRNFVDSGEPNKAAEHDLGLASANLVVEATTRRLHVHQMIGLDPDAARQAFALPEETEALTALAIGYRETSAHMNQALIERDTAPRSRRPLSEFVFTNRFGNPAGF